MTASGPATGPATIRPATLDDLPAIRDLLTLRDDRRWDDDSTRWFVHALDANRCLAWLAFAGVKPVALTTMFLRELRGPAGTYRAGYWANLFIDPAYRNQMLYPRLPLAMFEASRKLGLDFIYTSVRLRDLVTAHTRIGFARIGGMPLLAKPLRPFRLLGKYKHWPVVTALSPPLDGLFGGWLGARRAGISGRAEVQDVDVTSVAAAALAHGIHRPDRNTAVWTTESFVYRYRQTREATRYHVLVVRHGERQVGGLVYRVAERGEGIRAGVVMDAICEEGEERSLTAALAVAERHAHREGCELMMFLSGLGPEIEAVFRRFGYAPSPEVYELLLWPKDKVAATPALGELATWRFSFADHDAF